MQLATLTHEMYKMQLFYEPTLSLSWYDSDCPVSKLPNMPKPVRITHQRPGGHGRTTNRHNIYVANIPTDVTDKEIWRVFGNFGKIRNVRGVDQDGVAFVRFKEEFDALCAIAWCTNRKWARSSRRPVLAKFALSDFKSPTGNNNNNNSNNDSSISTTTTTPKDSRHYSDYAPVHQADDGGRFAVVNVKNPLSGKPSLVLMDCHSQTIVAVL